MTAGIQYCRVCDGCVGVLYVYGPANEPEHVHRDWNDPPKIAWNERQELGFTDIIVIPTHMVHVNAGLSWMDGWMDSCPTGCVPPKSSKRAGDCEGRVHVQYTIMSMRLSLLVCVHVP